MSYPGSSLCDDTKRLNPKTSVGVREGRCLISDTDVCVAAQRFQPKSKERVLPAKARVGEQNERELNKLNYLRRRVDASL